MKRHWTERELNEEWALSAEEQSLINSKQHKLVFALKLKFYERFGYSLIDIALVPQPVIEYIAKQVNVNVSDIVNYLWNSRVSREYNYTIRKYFNFRVMTKKDVSELKQWTFEHQLPFNLSYENLKASIYKHLFELKVEPYSLISMERYLTSWIHQFETRFFQACTEVLDDASKKCLDALIQEVPNEQNTTLSDLRQDLGKASLETITIGVQKLKYINPLISILIELTKYSINLLKKYHDQVMATPPGELREYADNKKYALLSCFCYLRSLNLTDDLIDAKLKLIHKISIRAKKNVMKEFWKDRRKIYNKDDILAELAKISIRHPKGIIEDKIYPEVSKETLESIIKRSRSFEEYYRERKFSYMRSSYVGHYRRMVSPIFDNLDFSTNEANNCFLLAINLIKKYKDSNLTYYPENELIPEAKVIPKRYYSLVVEVDKGVKRVNRINYEIALLLSLRTRLRCKEIWAKDAIKYGDPDKDLPQDYEENKDIYYNELNQPKVVSEFITKIKDELTKWLTILNKSIPRNKKVKIIKKRTKQWIKLSPLKPQAEPINLEKLKQEIAQRWPSTSLLDVLKEVELRLDLTSSFKSVASKEIINHEALQHKLLLSLFALATNTGLKRVSSNVSGVCYNDLKYIQRRFITNDNLRNAIIKVINSNLQIRDKELFGDVTISCASDSSKFSAWDQNLMTEWHVRYKGQGIMVYWHVDKKSVCVYSQLKACSSSEISAMIGGIIHHSTIAKIEKNYVDSHGQSLIAFAFACLLNFDLLPRLKGIGSEKLYTVEANTENNYKNIKDILTRVIKWDYIEENYDQMIKYATALRLRTAEPEALLKRFTANNLKHPVYQALQELGRAIKTIFICRYLYSEELRQEIQEGLNVIELWNSVNDFIFYGRKSIISSNEHISQELAILALHLLQASLVYINTLMIQQVLKAPEWVNRLNKEDKRALTPLIYAHINPYGIFNLDMSKRMSI